MEAVQFKMEHLDSFRPGEIETSAIGETDLRRAAVLNGWEEKAVSVVENGQVLGFVCILWGGGEAYVSFLLSDMARERPIRLARMVLSGIKEMKRRGARRIIADAQGEKAKRFLMLTGFEPRDGKFIHEC